LPRSSWLTIAPAPGRSCARSRRGGRGRNLALAKFGAAVGQVLAAEDASARIRSASGQAQNTGRTACPSARSIRSDSRAASGRLLEAARSSKRDPDGTEAGGLERSLSVTGNFGAGSGPGALMKGGRFAADSTLEGDGFVILRPGVSAQPPPGVVQPTKIKIAPEIGGRLFRFAAAPGKACARATRLPSYRTPSSRRGWYWRRPSSAARQTG
jgi:hypothetical protein